MLFEAELQEDLLTDKYWIANVANSKARSEGCKMMKSGKCLTL
jgi:hypothetical protein